MSAFAGEVRVKGVDDPVHERGEDHAEHSGERTTLSKA